MTTSIRVTDYSRAPRGLKWRSKTSFIVSTVTVGMFTDLFLYGLVVPILPFILSDRVSIPHADIQSYTSLLLACYAAASVFFSVPAGYIADRLPTRQLPFLVGLVSLTLSTVMLWLGRSLGILITARIIQGISAAVVWTIGMALVNDTVGSDRLGATVGFIFGVVSVAELVAPVVGGILYEKVGSWAVFGTGFLLLGVDFIMRLLVIEKKTAALYGLDTSSVKSDVEGQDRETDENSPLLGRQEDQEDWQLPKDPPAWAKHLPVFYCMRNPRLLATMVTQLMQALLLGVFEATIPTESQDLFGFDSMMAGLLFIPLIVPNLFLSPLAGHAVDKWGTKPAAVIGYAYIAIPLVLLRIPHAGGTAEIAKFCVFTFMAGCGNSLIGSASLVEASLIIKKYQGANKDFFGEKGPFAQLYAVNSLFFMLGLCVGPMIAGALRISIGYGNMNAVIAGLSIATSILSYIYIGGNAKMFRKGS